MTRSLRAALWPLLLGNFVIGTGVMAPAGLINELTTAFAVNVAAVGSLIAYGGALLCIEAPLLAFVTSRVDRRLLLASALFLFAVGHLASAWAGSFTALLAIRLVMIAAVASIIFKLLGREDLMMFCSFSVCLIALLYCGSYMILKRKY